MAEETSQDKAQEKAQDKAPDKAQDKPKRVDPRLLEILVCPRTKTSLLYDEARQELISRAARLAYPIRDGIPIMLEEEARQLDEEELRALSRR
jgi:uncharacterized protein